MSHQFALSAVGLKLIKSYEGFRETPKLLSSGHNIVGYGHVLDKTGYDVKLSPEEAESLLLEDLAPIEALVNDHVFAPMTQGQFDALCSLAFNIGTGAFLKSDVVYALNNGRIIDAANAFDVWRKSEINGETYVIDSLVRRRTAEKILFLRAERSQLLTTHSFLTPVADEILRESLDAEERLHKDSGIVAWPSSLPNYVANDDAASAPKKDIEGEVEQFENWLDEIPSNASDESTPEAEVLKLDEGSSGEAITQAQTISETLASLIEPESLVPENVVSEDDEIAEGVFTERPVEKSPVLMAASAVLGAKVLHDLSNDDDDEILDEAIKIETSDDIVSIEAETETSTADENDAIDEDVSQDEGLVTQTASSPITEAAEDFRKRLDALMDNPAQVESDAGEVERSAPDVAIPSSDLRPDNEVASKAYLEANPDPVEETFLSTTGVEPTKTAAVVKAAQNNRGRQDSAGKFIENLPPANKEPRSEGRPFVIMMVCGLVLVLLAVAAFLTGLDLKFGAAGLFASTVGLLFGFLLLLVAFYSWLKTRFTTA